ncbi:MAG TPA: hypothetical protein VGK99_18185 [Acidobacteriota bacterium]|jgi:positive regulator of sigma E activity
MSATLIYLIGYVIFVIGAAMGANMLGVSQRWIMIGVIILLGIGITTAATRTRRQEPPAEGR